MARSLISLNLFKVSYNTLAGNSQTIHDGFVTKVADYPAPNPTMPNFQTDIDALQDAITAWGIKGNRGSHVDHLNLVAAANFVRDDLRMLADYAQNTKPDDPDSWSTLGFKIKRGRSKPAELQIVQNFRNFLSRSVPPPAIKLKWKRPLDTDAGDVKGYLIQRNNTSEYPGGDLRGNRAIANVIGVVPNTAFIDEDPYVGENWYWVTPFNSLGFGVTSDPLKVISTKMKTV